MRSCILFFITCILPFSGFSETETVDGINWTYTVLPDGTASMYGEKSYYNDFSAIPRSTSGDITVPDIIDGRLVTGIGRYAFYDCKLLRSVSVPDCITSVGESAFANCTSLTSIVLRRVTDIGSAAFSGCYSLRSITLGKDLVRLGGHPYPSFSSCTNVTDATVPGWQCTIPFDSVTNLVISEGANCISNSAFSGCKKIERVVIPNSVTRIGSEAFEWCTSLKSVVIPSSVTNVGSHAFAYCSAMTNAVILGSGLSHTSSYSSNAPFHDCSNLVSVTTMDTCAYMFKNCNKMQEITLLDGLEKIKDYSFYGCSWLKEIEIPNSVKDIGRYAFYDCIGLKCVEFKNSNTRIPYWTTTYSDGSKTYDYPFDGCNSIVDVTIPQHACIMTLAKTFPDSYQSITNIVVLDGVTRIGAECFKNCFGVKRIVIPASVTAIYDNAFQNCSALEEIVFLGDAPDVGSDILLGTPRSLKITVKEGSVGWKGGVSTELPEAWPVGDATARGIVYYDDSVEVAAMTPVITPADGSIFVDRCEISISCAAKDAKIYYRTDGKTPKLTDSYLYNGPFLITDTSKIVVLTVKEGFENGFASATITKRVLSLSEAAGSANLSFTTGGAANWVAIGDSSARDGLAARSGKIGDSDESWMELTVSGSGTLSFDCKVSCEDDPFFATWDHLSIIVDGKESDEFRFDGEVGWENISIAFESEGNHTVRWAYVKDESDFEGDDCAWVSGLEWEPDNLIVAVGEDKNIVVPAKWIKRYDDIIAAAKGDKIAALQRTAANGRKVWECFMLGLDPTKAEDNFRITRFWMKNDRPMFEFSHLVDGIGNSFASRIKVKGKANLSDIWSDVPARGDPKFRFFTVEVTLP